MSGAIELPAGPFDVILADPPWRFASNSARRPGRNARAHYPCMTADEIAEMPVHLCVGDSCLLLLWATAPMLPDALAVMDLWGFRYKSQVVWIKDRIGTGYWVRNRHELLLIGTHRRPHCPRPLFADSVIEAPRRQHSRKPGAIHEAAEAAYPDARKLELFARAERPGWTVQGNETRKFTDMQEATS